MREWIRYHVSASLDSGSVKDAWARLEPLEDPPRDKQKFFERYFLDYHRILDDFLRSEISIHDRVLSIGSSTAINELSLISDGYKVICSDLEIPPSYSQEEEIFGHFPYQQYNVLEGPPEDIFDCICCLGVMYLFDGPSLHKFFEHAAQGLSPGGILLIYPGGGKDSRFSLFWDEYVLHLEKQLLARRKNFFFSANNAVADSHGFKHKNEEIISIAESYGFLFVRLEQHDFLTEFRRSGLVRRAIDRNKVIKEIMSKIGSINPYIRLFKFEKSC